MGMENGQTFLLHIPSMINDEFRRTVLKTDVVHSGRVSGVWFDDDALVSGGYDKRVVIRPNVV